MVKSDDDEEKPQDSSFAKRNCGDKRYQRTRRQSISLLYYVRYQICSAALVAVDMPVTTKSRHKIAVCFQQDLNNMKGSEAEGKTNRRHTCR